MASKQKKTPKGEQWVLVSGGFDPIHIGHVRMFEEARKLGDKLVVVINNDNWLRSKKGYVFMSDKERREIIGKFPFVDKVVLTSHKKDDPDRSVSRELAKLKPALFANGGDRKSTKDIPEAVVCKELGIKMVFNVGAGGKVQSSSWMIGGASRNVVRSVRPWGEFYGWDAGAQWKLKTISMKIGEPLFVDVQAVHRLESKKGGIVVEIALGKFDENDIVRVEDDHGRV
jgi:D-beta-D-heptose 7-phosphate kinase/D-beta-D-heptose 1-phosphate adenosyltransferase